MTSDWNLAPWLITNLFPNTHFTACTFHSTNEYPSADTDSGKFVRIKEDHPVGEEVFAIDVYPRSVTNRSQQLESEIVNLALLLFFV